MVTQNISIKTNSPTHHIGDKDFSTSTTVVHHNLHHIFRRNYQQSNNSLTTPRRNSRTQNGATKRAANIAQGKSTHCENRVLKALKQWKRCQRARSAPLRKINTQEPLSAADGRHMLQQERQLYRKPAVELTTSRCVSYPIQSTKAQTLT